MGTSVDTGVQTERLLSKALRALLVSVVVYGASASTATLRPQTSEVSPLHSFVVDPFEESFGFSYVSGTAKQSVLGRFGEPIRIESSHYGARTSDQTITSYTIHYDGLKFVVNENEAKTWSWLESTEISNNENVLKFGLRIGSTRQEVLSALENPHNVEHRGGLRFVAYVTQDGHGFELELAVSLDSSGLVTKYVISNFED